MLLPIQPENRYLFRRAATYRKEHAILIMGYIIGYEAIIAAFMLIAGPNPITHTFRPCHTERPNSHFVVLQPEFCSFLPGAILKLLCSEGPTCLTVLSMRQQSPSNGLRIRRRFWHITLSMPFLAMQVGFLYSLELAALLATVVNKLRNLAHMQSWYGPLSRERYL